MKPESTMSEVLYEILSTGEARWDRDGMCTDCFHELAWHPKGRYLRGASFARKTPGEDCVQVTFPDGQEECHMKRCMWVIAWRRYYEEVK